MDVVVVLDDLGAVGDEVVVVAFGVSVSTVVVVDGAACTTLEASCIGLTPEDCRTTTSEECSIWVVRLAEGCELVVVSDDEKPGD
jgi:hypothetical protein